MSNLANVAAQIHANMCDDEGFGYSWEERYGTYADPVYYDIDGRTYGPIYRGDFDCSSSVITAWRIALQHTPYADALDGASYTGNMRYVFASSGLFDVWDTYSTSAVRGDVYLNDANHTAMCQDGGMGDGPYGYDCLSEFSWGDNGAYGNQRGDQSGWESHITGFYDYPWDCTLHYNGAADGSESGDTPAPAPAPSPEPTPSGGAPSVRYRVSVDPNGNDWFSELEDFEDLGGSGDDFAGEPGEAIRWIAIDFGGNGWYQVMTQANGWLEPVRGYDVNDLEYGCAGDGSPILAVRAYYETPEPTDRYYVAEYRVAALNSGYYPWMHDTEDTGGSSDDYAGDGIRPIDRFQLHLI